MAKKKTKSLYLSKRNKIDSPVNDALVEDNYRLFNDDVAAELKLKITLAYIVGTPFIEPPICIRLDAAQFKDVAALGKGIKALADELLLATGKFGLYLLWADHGESNGRLMPQKDPKVHKNSAVHKVISAAKGDLVDYRVAQAIYVGKGHIKKRVRRHMEKFLAEEGTIYVTFYRCSNRIAKYLEQLCLDHYLFPLNIAENFGKELLYARWSLNTGREGTVLADMATIKSERAKKVTKVSPLKKPSDPKKKRGPK